MTAAEFLLGLLDLDDPVCLDWEDAAGPHAGAVALWRRMGLVAREPAGNPTPTCPVCGEGTPYRVCGTWRCGRCRSAVDERHLLVWPVDVPAVFDWMAGQLGLRGNVRPVDGRLWQLGTAAEGADVTEYFYLRGQAASTAARGRLAAYRDAVVLHGPAHPRIGRHCHAVALPPLLAVGRSMRVLRSAAIGGDRTVRFDAASGALWAGGRLLGEIPVGSREYHFVHCLASRLDRVVPYADIRRYVAAAAGSRDATDEATFCQQRKSRIKRRWVPEIDRLIGATNKGDGYRLRARLLATELVTTHVHWLQEKADWLQAKFAWCAMVDWSCVTPQWVGT